MATIGQRIAAGAIANLGPGFGYPPSYMTPSKWAHVYPTMGGDYTPSGTLGQMTLPQLKKIGQFSAAAAKVDPIYAAYQWRTDPSVIHSRYVNEYNNFLDKLYRDWTYGDPAIQADLRAQGLNYPWISFTEFIGASDARTNPIARAMYGDAVFAAADNRIMKLRGGGQFGSTAAAERAGGG